MSDRKDSYDVQVDWPTVVPLGDTLAVKTNDDLDDGWVKAFEVVLDEHQRRAPKPDWQRIDFEYASNGKETRFALFVRKVAPGAKAAELRRTLDDLVETANRVALVGPHVYELARELREPPPAGPRQSAPPPSFDEPGEEPRAA